MRLRTSYPSARRFVRNDDGATLVEFGIVLALFLLLFFGLIDFGRMAFHYVTAEKAMQVAARVAAVRPAACAGVPETHIRGTTTTPPQYGTNCGAGLNICANVGTVTCSGNAANATAAEIWTIVQGTLPNDALIANLSFSYANDPNLGFLGGPYVPVVTVALQNLNFRFVSPLGQLVTLSGGTAPGNLPMSLAFPDLSVSLPGEDLALGNGG